MFACINGSGRKLALVALFSQAVLFASSVSASPLTSDDLESLSPVARARGGKYVGSRCTDNSQCYSESCISDLAFGGEASIFRCRRQEPGGPCFEKNNCGSRICKSDGACDFAGTLGRCDTYFDCYGWLSSTTQCVSHRCKIVQGSACTKASECITGICDSQVCRAAPQVPNSPCGIDSECLSGSCTDSIEYDQCTNPDGSFTRCAYSPSNKYCARYPLGHSCDNDGQCNERLCKGGVCTASQDGDGCAEQYQCTGDAICGTDGKCFTPANGTLASNAVCDFDAQCISGRCVTDQLQKPYNGINTVTLKDQYPPRCDYLKNGESGCTSFYDCATGICVDGTCQAGQDGQVNYNCENLCSLNDLCYTPSGPQGKGQPCKDASQCLSGSCNFGYNSVNRPVLGGSNSDFLIGTDDTSCAGSGLGQSCDVDNDCSQGTCQSGVCATLPLNASCQEGYQCASGNCAYSDPSDASSGTCQLADTGDSCTSDSQCYSGVCTYYPGPPYCNGPCPGSSSCNTAPAGGPCRNQDGCGNGLTCTAGTCVSNDPGSSSTTTTSSTTSATETSTSTSTDETSTSTTTTTTTTTTTSTPTSTDSSSSTSSATPTSTTSTSSTDAAASSTPTSTSTTTDSSSTTTTTTTSSTASTTTASKSTETPA